jgi:hypothetical protein
MMRRGCVKGDSSIVDGTAAILSQSSVHSVMSRLAYSSVSNMTRAVAGNKLQNYRRRVGVKGKEKNRLLE